MIEADMATLNEICAYADERLRVSEVPDYPGAMNGLQLENVSGEVGKVIAAVDATLPVVEKAVAVGGDLLVVHHGMFWQGAQMLTGSVFAKIRLAMESGLALYSAHIPLDVHGELGNNAVLVRELGLEGVEAFFPWKGIELGLRGRFLGSRGELVARLEEVVGGAVHCCAAGPEDCGVVGVVTGGAGSEVAAMKEAGVDTFITGEGPHWSYTAAEELGVNVLYGGHYATETFGVKALAEELAGKFGVEWEFVSHPTGM